MSTTLLFTRAVQYLILLLGISLHEAAHAWAAARRGDATATLLGRASLNPLRHLDPMGSVLLPLLLIYFGFPVFGWGRPTPVVVQNLRDPWRDDVRVTAAGSLANLLLAAAATVTLALAVRGLGKPVHDVAFLTLIQQFSQAGHLPGFPLLFTLVQIVSINLFLAVFHLLPLPPLDGGQILLALMPPDWAERYAALRPYGFLCGIFLAVGATALLVPFLALFLALVAGLSG